MHTVMFETKDKRGLKTRFSPSSTATLSRLRLMFIGATIVHVLVLGSYLSTELSELWAAPGYRRKSYYFIQNVSSPGVQSSQ